MAKRYMRRKMQVTWYGDDFLDVVHKYGDEALFAAGGVVLKAAVRNAPRKTGKLVSSAYVSTATKSTYKKRAYWRKEKKPPVNGATVGFSAPHAHLIESGRRKSGKFGPTARRRKQRSGNLALTIGGRYYARSKYTRMRSRPFLGPALEETKTTMVEELALTLRTKLERLLGAVRL